MTEITTLRKIRPMPSPAELDAMRLAARQQFVAGTAAKQAGPRWRLPVLAGGLTAAAAVTASGVLVLSSSPAATLGRHATAGHAGTVVTTAWTVREAANGTVTIYLRQYADPAGLQRTLRADGINAIVRPIPYTVRTVVFPGVGPQPKKKDASARNTASIARPTCAYSSTGNASAAVQQKVVTVVKQSSPAHFVIHPAEMRQGSALFLAFMANVPVKTSGTANFAMKPIVLRTSAVPACVPVSWGNKAGPAPNVARKATFAPKAP